MSRDDDRDGWVLALELARRHEQLRVLREPAPEVAELAGLCEQLRALIDQRTALVQQLKATLRQYYPAALQFFSDWTSPAAWDFLEKFPTPQKLAHARKDTLLRFLKSHRIGLRSLWLERIERRHEATEWPQPGNALALEMTALALAAQLSAIEPHIRKADKLIQQSAKHVPQVQLLRSLPGAGDRLAPALAAMACLIDDEDNPLEALRALSGVAPVPHQSGKRCKIHMRRRCNKHWRNNLHQFAFCSLRFCDWAKAYYKLCRDRGNTHATALRKLADKWLHIIVRMVQTGQAYDEKRYLRALRANGSPVYEKLCGKPCG